MKFEWDPGKSEANFEKHGIRFEETSCIFDGPTLTRRDDRQDYGEDRDISLGALSAGTVLVVVHTERENKIRLISARKASRRERKLYHDHLAQADEGY